MSGLVADFLKVEYMCSADADPMGLYTVSFASVGHTLFQYVFDAVCINIHN